MKRVGDTTKTSKDIVIRDVLLIYSKSIGYVLLAYAAMTISYIPAILSQATNVIMLMQEVLEIGAYGPVVVTAPSISYGLYMLSQKSSKIVKENKKDILIKVLKGCFRSGIVAMLSFIIYFSVLLSVLPARPSDPVEQFLGAPHSSVYLCNSIIPCVLFHGLLLLFVATFASVVFIASFGVNKNICVSFSFTVLVFQSIAYLNSILGTPRKYRIMSIYSGWFWIGNDTPIQDLIWAAFIVLVYCVPFVLYILIRQPNKDPNQESVVMISE